MGEITTKSSNSSGSRVGYYLMLTSHRRPQEREPVPKQATKWVNIEITFVWAKRRPTTDRPSASTHFSPIHEIDKSHGSTRAHALPLLPIFDFYTRQKEATATASSAAAAGWIAEMKSRV